VAPVTVQDYTWSAEAVSLFIGGIDPRQSWSFRQPSGETTAEEGDAVGPGPTRRALEYFLDTFWRCFFWNNLVGWSG